MHNFQWPLQKAPRLEYNNIKALGVTCDGASINRRMLKLHGDSYTYKTTDIYSSDGKYDFTSIYMILQMVYMHNCNIDVYMFYSVMANPSSGSLYVMFMIEIWGVHPMLVTQTNIGPLKFNQFLEDES